MNKSEAYKIVFDDLMNIGYFVNMRIETPKQ